MVPITASMTTMMAAIASVAPMTPMATMTPVLSMLTMASVVTRWTGLEFFILLFNIGNQVLAELLCPVNHIRVWATVAAN